MLKLAVVGRDVEKSLSPEIHKFIAARTGGSLSYDKISLPNEDFNNGIKKILREYDGFNVTVPYKLSVMHYLKEVRGDAALFGAVNTVVCRERAGFNTDGEGFMMSLKAAKADLSCKTALVLGAGGAGRSIAKKLLSCGAEVSIYDRHWEKSLAVAVNSPVKPLERLEVKPYFAIINATGTGMSATEGQSPAGKELIELCTVAIDLIYDPEQSEFLRVAEECKKQTANGLGMLFFQAYLSQCIFFGRQPVNGEAEELFKEFSGERK